MTIHEKFDSIHIHFIDIIIHKFDLSERVKTHAVKFKTEFQRYLCENRVCLAVHKFPSFIYRSTLQIEVKVVTTNRALHFFDKTSLPITVHEDEEEWEVNLPFNPFPNNKF